MGSNLLYKASIVTTPTAYGVGVLNSIKPAQYLGEELVTNGDFSNGYVGWNLSGNPSNYSVEVVNYEGRTNALHFTTPDNNTGVNQIILQSNKQYLVKFDLKVISGNVYVGKSDNKVTGGNLNPSEWTSYEQYWTANDTYFRVYSSGTAEFYLDNVSVKEQIDADFDFTRNSSATRVNPDYLIQDVSILSSNLVQNGNFSELGSELIINGNFETNSNWVYFSQWNISNNKANFLDTSGGVIYQNGVTLTSGKTYELKFTISDSLGNASLLFANSSGSVVYYGSDYASYADGSYTLYITMPSSQTTFGVYANTSGNSFSIDNVSVKQVDPNDEWILGGSGNNKATIGFNSATIASVDNNSYIQQNNVLVSGKIYRVTYTIISSTANNALKIVSSLGLAEIPTTVGTHTVFGTAITTTFYIERTTNGQSTTITDISVLEVQQTDIPRLDYTNGTASILLEPQSTNLQTKSNEFSTWSLVSNVTRTVDYTLSPEGVSNATRLQFTSNGFVANSTITSGTQYTVSVYAKRNDTGTQSFGFFVDGSGAVNSEMSLTSEWKRFNFTHTATNGSYVGLAGSSGADVSVYGMQIEALTYSTSYIPTSGSTVTRAAETLNNAGNSDLISSTEGVLYAEISAFDISGDYRLISLSDGTNSNRVFLGFRLNTGYLYYFVVSGGSTQSDFITTKTSVNQFSKIAVKYKANDFALWIDGVKVYADSSGNAPVGLDRLQFTDADGSTRFFFGRCKSVAVFKEALSDTELACLTSTNNREIFLNYYYRMQYVGANTEALSCAEQTFNI